MENEKVFETKTGFCHILPDRIVLTRDGQIGTLSKVVVGNNIARILLMYGGLASILFYASYDVYQQKEFIPSIVFAVFGCLLLIGIAFSLNNSATPVIQRSKIKKVKFVKGILGLTRSRFIIHFENEQGKIKKRLIMLPGSLSDGNQATKEALVIMTEEAFIKPVNKDILED